MSASPLSVADVLDRAADRLEPEGAWGDHCASTAIDSVSQGDWRLGSQANNFFARYIGSGSDRFGVWSWNDAPERTQSEVVSALREAAAKARAEQVTK
jgi:hypothetical protein